MDDLVFNHVAEVGVDYRAGGRAPVGGRVPVRTRRFDRVGAGGVAFGAGTELTEYIDCSFDGARLKSVIAGYSRFVRCSFRDVDIKGLGDDYLELVDCVFTGKLRSTVFWGAPPQPNARLRYESHLRFLAREGRSERPGYSRVRPLRDRPARPRTVATPRSLGR